MIRGMAEPTDPQAGPEPQPGSDSPMAMAYEERTKQLYDARAALSGAVSALTAELANLRRDLDRAAVENRGLKHQERALREHIEVLVQRIEALERELAVIRNMKVLRWTAWPRRIVYRLRARRP